MESEENKAGRKNGPGGIIAIVILIVVLLFGAYWLLVAREKVPKESQNRLVLPETSVP